MTAGTLLVLAFVAIMAFALGAAAAVLWLIAVADELARIADVEDPS